MGYFAVIGKDVHVERCHVNVWRYDGWLTPRVFCFDVGLGIKAGANPSVKSFDLALPFSCDGYVDLYETMRDVKTVPQLIFGREIRTGIDHTITYKYNQNDVTLKLISPDVSRVDDHKKSGRDYSLWHIEMRSPPPSGEEFYMRLRFHVGNFSRSWCEHHGGELIDIRVADTRESVSIEAWNSFSAEIAPLRNLRIFIVAPAELEPRTSSPPYRARGLERRVWMPYTGGRSWTLPRSAIYGFAPENKPAAVSMSDPFRLYFSLSSRRTRLWVKLLVLLVALTLGAAMGYLIGSPTDRARALDELLALWRLGWGYITSVAALALLWEGREILGKVTSVQGWMRWVDRKILFEKHRC